MKIAKLVEIREIIQDIEAIILDRNISNEQYRTQCLNSKVSKLITTINEVN